MPLNKEIKPKLSFKNAYLILFNFVSAVYYYVS